MAIRGGSCRSKPSVQYASDQTRIDLNHALDLVAETGAAAYEPSIREELGWLDHDESEWRAALQLYDKMGASGQVERLQAELGQR
ncbi:MAG TPA: hypothetical protein VF180_14735 [Acidimicrobiia bacterium]